MSLARKNSSTNEDWVIVQKKTFTRWTNSYLTKRKLLVEDIAVDLQDGTKLGALLEIISGEKLNKMNATPKIELQKLENLNKCIQFLKDHGIPLVNIGSQDVFKGNEKLILGLIWTIILRFEIGDGDGKNGLLLWVQRSCKGYKDVDPPNVQNFVADWNTGLPFCAIIHRYRPDLLNYDSLSKDEAEKNCELAFKIAEEKLGISRLLDVADVANHPKPDEKSIIAYVSQFFKLFAKASKNDALIKSIKNAVEVTKRHDAWVSKYDANAKEVSAFCDKAKSKWSAASNSRTTAQVQKEIEEFSNYMRKEKPEKQTLRSEAEGIASQLTNSKRNNKRPEHNPAIPPAVNAKKWSELEDAERTKERNLLEKYTRFCEVDAEAAKFNTKAGPVEVWVEERLQFFSKNALPPTASITEIESRLEQHAGFEARLKQYDQVLGQLQELEKSVQGLSKGEHDGEGNVTEKMKKLKGRVELLRTEGQKAKAVLEAAMLSEKEAVDLERRFIQMSDALDFDLDQLESEVGESIVVNSANDVTRLKKEVETMKGDLKKVEAQFTGELKPLAEKIKARRPQHAAHAEKESARVKNLDANIKKREDALSKALTDESKRDAARDKFAEMANKLNGDFEKANSDLSNVSSGGALESQLEKVQKVKEKVNGPMREDLKKVDELAMECDKLKIVVNEKTPHTAFSLRAAHEQLSKTVGEEESSINSQILAKKSLEVTPEQLKEIQEVFAFFDSSGNGYLELPELKEACTGAGIDLADDEIERRMSAIAPNMKFTLDNFTTFMLAQIKTGDTIEHVMNAFKEIGEGAEQIPAEKLDAVFQTEPELNTYVKTNMPDGNFVKFTQNLFSR